MGVGASKIPHSSAVFRIDIDRQPRDCLWWGYHWRVSDPTVSRLAAFVLRVDRAFGKVRRAIAEVRLSRELGDCN
jgi:hypothetical protein